MLDSVGFWKRFAAGILDSFAVGIPLMIILMIINVDEMQEEMIMSIVQLLYLLILPVVWHGYTVGKKLMDIRIVRVDGKKVGIGTMLLRNVVASLVYVMTLGIGYIVSAFMVGLRKDHRAIHDFIAGTYVTSKKP
ncbi:MAG: RDD family protein [Bacillus sp. (in: firmicutes)]